MHRKGDIPQFLLWWWWINDDSIFFFLRWTIPITYLERCQNPSLIHSKQVLLEALPAASPHKHISNQRLLISLFNSHAPMHWKCFTLRLSALECQISTKWNGYVCTPSSQLMELSGLFRGWRVSLSNDLLVWSNGEIKGKRPLFCKTLEIFDGWSTFILGSELFRCAPLGGMF